MKFSSSKKILFLFYFLILVAVAHQANAGSAGAIDAAVDLYWVVFGGDSPTDGVFLAEIDQDGNVTKQPKLVITAEQIGSTPGSSAIAKGPKKTLNIWRFGGSALYRAVIKTSTRSLSKISKLSPVSNDADILQVSQNSKDNFLILETGTSVLQGFALKKSGSLKGPKWDLIAGAPNLNDEAGLSADGLIATSVRYIPNSNAKDALYIQNLNPNGSPNGTAKLLASFVDIESSDVSNPLSDGKRFIAYVVVEGTANKGRLLLQKIDAKGKKIGAAKKIYDSPLREETEQIVAIDPNGRFVLFTVEGTSFGCPGKDVLVYRSLTAKGKASGSLKEISGCSFVQDDIIGIDLLKQQ